MADRRPRRCFAAQLGPRLAARFAPPCRAVAQPCRLTTRAAARLGPPTPCFGRHWVAPSTSDLLPIDSQLSSSHVVRQRMCIDAAPTESCPPKPTLPSRGRPKCRLLESTSDFPTDFQFSRTHRVRSQQLRKPSELSQPVLPATTSNKKRVAPNTSDSLPIDSQPSSSRVVRQRMSMNAAPTETGQPDPTFPSGGRPKRKLLESTIAVCVHNNYGSHLTLLLLRKEKATNHTYRLPVEREVHPRAALINRHQPMPYLGYGTKISKEGWLPAAK
ncbi:hypothetical protein EJB05_12543, partial [Eragrostis curvula]